jgi:threonine/homoserine/homoserine lactone efflux protein
MLKVFSQGTMVNILNAKTALFFFAFLPQECAAPGLAAAQAVRLSEPELQLP